MRVDGIPYVQGRNSYSNTTKYAIAIHNTSNPTASAENEASYAQRRDDGISAHFYVDRDSVIQSLDTNARAGHAGSTNGNRNAIAVEICGTNDKSREWWLANVDWKTFGRVMRQVCAAHGIPVQRVSVADMQNRPTSKGFYSHDDMRRAWGGTTHTDPGPNFPWDKLFSAVRGDDVHVQEGNAMALSQETIHIGAWGPPVGNLVKEEDINAATALAVACRRSAEALQAVQAMRAVVDGTNGQQNTILEQLNIVNTKLDRIITKIGA